MDKRLVVVVDSWPVDSTHPQGHYVHTLGVIGDKDTETVGTVRWETRAPRHVYSMCTDFLYARYQHSNLPCWPTCCRSPPATCTVNLLNHV